jgi:hypothetical protein
VTLGKQSLKIVKSGRMVADGCRIVGLVKMYNDNIKTLNYKVKLLINTCMYKN